MPRKVILKQTVEFSVIVDLDDEEEAEALARAIFLDTDWSVINGPEVCTSLQHGVKVYISVKSQNVEAVGD